MKYYDRQTIRAFLSNPQVRPLLSWRGIEKAAGLNPYTIKNLVRQDKALSDQEHERLTETLVMLGIDYWAESLAKQNA